VIVQTPSKMCSTWMLTRHRSSIISFSQMKTGRLVSAK